MATEPAFFVRRADPDDIDTLNALYDRIYPEDAVVLEALAYFHAVDRGVLKKTEQRTKFLLSLIETSFIAVTVEDEESHVVGFAVLDDTPLQLSATEDAGTDWESWFQDTFELPGIDSSNSLWFSTCLIDGDPSIMGEILRTTFSTMPELRSVLTFVPATITEEGAMKILQPFQSHFAQLDVTQLKSYSCAYRVLCKDTGFKVLDVQHKGVLGCRELSRLAWAMEPKLDFEDLSAFWRLLGGSGGRLPLGHFCRALTAPAAAVVSPAARGRPAWREVARSYAGGTLPGASVKPKEAQEALDAFIKKWKAPKAPPAAPPAKAALDHAVSAPKALAAKGSGAAGTLSSYSEEFEDDKYSEGTRYSDSERASTAK